MLAEDVEVITSSSEGQKKRRKVEFGESDGESDSDSEGDESDYEEGEELQASARTKQKSRVCSRKHQVTKKGMFTGYGMQCHESFGLSFNPNLMGNHPTACSGKLVSIQQKAEPC